MSFYFENHWKCMNKHGGHAILLGIQYTRGRAYNVLAYEISVDICILGFAFGFKK
jgi:hypothetical protein